MTEFQFNCKTTANHIMAIANRRHHLAVHEARARQDARAAARQARDAHREQALDIALRVACIIGTVTALAVLSAVFAG